MNAGIKRSPPSPGTLELTGEGLTLNDADEPQALPPLVAGASGWVTPGRVAAPAHPGPEVLTAGGGVKGGHVHGATDEFGWHAVENKVHVHDRHATILHVMGIDHERLTYRDSGRDSRLTDVHGRVVKEILA
jgi:hypothetical protein